MSLLLSNDALIARGDVVARSLAPLAESLAGDLGPLVTDDLYFPEEKALLSREGGRCPRHGVLLAFDPWSPHEHRCPVDGEVFMGDLHHRFWIYWYQLWLAERAVHAAALSRLGIGQAAFANLAARILDGYAERYVRYPNVDNVLGPTRLFFSTYLESIWLLQICIATDLVSSMNRELAERVRDRIIEPSREIIAGYDEHGSNRQVWNDAALLAAARLLGDTHAAERWVLGQSGVASQLEHGLLADGTWYEGENYHLFAHRGLWYGVTMAEQAGIAMPPSLTQRFQRGFVTPFLTALPDFTLPSRRDSQYKISLHQWRIAEHCELGLARQSDPALIGALYRMYHDDIPRRETGRRTSSADVERNAPPSTLTRADLSWRALLCALPKLPPLEPIAPASALLESQGIAVFRRNEGRTYVALDYGHSGGGHGHPDRLNVLLANGETRWLDDPGTGSYVDPTLHWYRSTLAHNAPLVNGASQRAVDGTLVAYEENGGEGWIEATANGIAPGVGATRSIVVMPGYLVDELSVDAEKDITVDLPIHADVSLDGSATSPADGILEGGVGLEDGFRFLRDGAFQCVEAGAVVRGEATLGDQSLGLWAQSNVETNWWRVCAPGAPGTGDQTFRVLRAVARHTRHRFVLAWSPHVAVAEMGDVIRVTMTDGSVHTHRRTGTGWELERIEGNNTSTAVLGGRRPPVSASHRHPEPSFRHAERSEGSAPPVVTPVTLELGEHHYRRSEQSWSEAGRPTATIGLRRAINGLEITVAVHRSDRTFAPADAVNRYDNEHADINGDGVQLHVKTPNALAGWTLIPERDSERVRVRAIGGTQYPNAPHASWHQTPNGYEMTIELAQVPLAIDVIINEMPRGRERRRGQLVMSGAEGEFVYLRGDRQDEERLVPLRTDDA